MLRATTFVMTGASPAAASTALVGTAQGGLERYSELRIDAFITGGTGGTVDLYLQRWVATGVWLDWAHFTQVAAATTKIYSGLLSTQGVQGANLVNVGYTNDDLSSGALVLAAGTFIGGVVDKIRMVAVAGAGTSAGAVQTIYVTGHQLYS